MGILTMSRTEKEENQNSPILWELGFDVFRFLSSPFPFPTIQNQFYSSDLVEENRRIEGYQCHAIIICIRSLPIIFPCEPSS
jgi:hypothetical protein